MLTEIDCPICDDGTKHRVEVLKCVDGKFRRRNAEFDAKVYIVRCLDCGTTGLVRVVEQVGMELYEFPYEGDL
ncbi:MAG: hypothetical protein ABWW66_07405 [Archaeoglobaceae archaeon]